MIRVLQLAKNQCDQQTSVALSQLSQAGLQFHSTIVQVCEELPLAMRQVATWRRKRPYADLVHAWDEVALRIAAFSSDLPIVFSPATYPNRETIRWLRAIAQYRSLFVIAPTRTIHRALIERGINGTRCRLIYPGVDFARIHPTQSRALRGSLGIKPNDRVILAVGESSRVTDHQRAIWASVILHVLDGRHRIVLWGDGPTAEQVVRFAEKLRQPDLFIVARQRLGSSISFEDLVGVADVALVTNAAPAPVLPIAMCMAAGASIVSVTDSTTCELLEDRHNALLTTSRRPRVIARRILDFFGDGPLRAACSEQARGEAYEQFSKVRFLNEMLSLYEEVIRN